MSDTRVITSHYETGGLGDRILAGLRASGKNPDAGVSIDDLVAVDHYHSCGKDATLDVLKLADIPKGAKVLDVGGGIGGPARLVAKTADAQVTVVDLTDEYVKVGELLTQITKLSDRVKFIHASALEMPVPDGSFDVAWLQHSTMNIPDKKRLFAEIRRVVRPGGKVVMHEIMKGPSGDPHYPITWASHPSASFVNTPEEYRQLIKEAGLVEKVWKDVTADTLGWIAARRPDPSKPPPPVPPLGLHTLHPDFPKTLGPNYVRSLNEGRAVVVQALLTRP